MAAKKHGLGRGLGALIPDTETQIAEDNVSRETSTSTRPVDIFFSGSSSDSGSSHASAIDLLMPRKKTTKTAKRASSLKRENSEDVSHLQPVPGASFAQLPIKQIVPNAAQPRSVFDEEELDELAASIREVGVLQPIVVRSIGTAVEPKYELIMGERRWRASQIADLEEVPAIIRQTDDVDMLRDALLENLHRVQLNPIEEAAAYQQMMDDFNATQAELAEKIHKSRSHIANTLRLLRLPAPIQKRLAAGVLSAGHARALLGLESESQMLALSDRIVNEGLSVRSTEELVALGEVPSMSSGSRKRRTVRTVDPRFLPLIERLTDYLDTRVTIRQSRKHGSIVIDFTDEDDLNRIVEGLMAKTSTRR